MRSKGHTILSKMSDKTSKVELQMENPWNEVHDRPIDDENKLIPDYYIDRPVIFCFSCEKSSQLLSTNLRKLVLMLKHKSLIKSSLIIILKSNPFYKCLLVEQSSNPE
jgi:hypothetical protein